MTDSQIQRIIESLTRDNEEKIYQMSHVRIVAETMVRGLHEPNYFTRVCNDFVKIFDAKITGLYWFRQRDPAGWWLEAWASEANMYRPAKRIITKDEEGILEWVRTHNKPLFANAEDTLPILSQWQPELGEDIVVGLMPLKIDETRHGLYVLVDPIFKISPKNLQRHIEIISRLLVSGSRNRLLYKRLHESEDEYRDLVQNSSDMVVVLYRDGVIRDCNRMFSEALMLNENPAGKHMSRYLVADKDNLFATTWAELLAGKSVRNVDLKLRRSDGAEIIAELSGNIKSLPDGTVGMVRLYLRDLTERLEVERRQRELELELNLMQERQLAQVGLYVSGIAHNLQNPVQVLLGYLDVLKMKGIEFQELDFIEQSTRNIADIIRNLLSKMREESNRDSKLINLNELLQNELSFLNANLYFKHEVNKEYDFDDFLPEIWAVYSDFSQAMLNIIYNALEAMSHQDEKKLTILTRYNDDDNSILISITDTGPGIPADVQERIFKPFFTTKKAEKDHNSGIDSGSGLGLSSAISLLKPYGAEITFDTKIDDGTTFHIRVPVKLNEDDTE